MTSSASSRTFLQRARPWLIAIGLVQLALRIGGRVAAQRLDVGDETADELRRVQTLGQVSVRPTSQELASARFDLVLAGLNLDLTQARPAPGGTDITMNCALAGGDIRVPAAWKIVSDSRGAGGVTVKGAAPDVEPEDPTAPEVRVHLSALLGGVTVTRLLQPA
jgi:hypothetical protein